jgi:hypothetical protein
MADFYISSSPTPIGDPDERERMPLVSVDVVYDFYFRLPTSDFRLPASAPTLFSLIRSNFLNLLRHSDEAADFTLYYCQPIHVCARILEQTPRQ